MSDEKRLSAENCQTMDDVRKGVDAVDRLLVDLLVERFTYMDAAARIKETRASVRDEVRKAKVIENVRKHARLGGLPEGLTDQLWEVLVETSIAHEFNEWDNIKPGQ